MPLPHSLRAFRHRDYRLWYVGQGVSQTGTWLQLIATSWLIYDLSHSAFLLGVAAFAQHIPMLVLAPFAGVWVDRMKKRQVMMVTSTIALAQALAMLALILFGHIEAWHLVVSNLALGIVNAFDSPARQAQLVELVGGREDLPNAIAFSSMLMNGARFVGPMIGGWVIAGFGVAWGFGLNSLLRVAVLLALWLVRAAPRPTEKGDEGLLRQLAEGVRYAYGFLPTRAALLLLSAVSFGAQPYQSLAPYFARDIYHGGSEVLGYLIGAGGAGAISGMAFLAMRPSVRGLLSQIPFTAALSGLALIVFSYSTTLWLGLPMLFCVGMGAMITASSTNTILQTIVEDRMRARVIALYMMSFLGVLPLGALVSGTIGEHLGPPAALAMGGGLVLVAAVAYWFRLPRIRAEIRPVYEKLGIVPRPKD